MREFSVGAVVFIVGFILLLALGSAVTIWGLFFNRHAAPYAEETRRITYGQSFAYQQGSQRDFENLCLQYAQATDASARAISADTIRRRAQDYVGPPLEANIAACIARVGD